ncbi:hypothetical protein Sjap_007680 [Stephania japonica]|uniref:Uncharacterized protein n=1 Tax=Stephania japonica TaxID=461633 RepID=A0AAP0HZN9_9MAGN
MIANEVINFRGKSVHGSQLIRWTSYVACPSTINASGYFYKMKANMELKWVVANSRFLEL